MAGADCPVEGCQRAVKQGQLMCRIHWGCVSVPTQRDVYATWRALCRGNGADEVAWTAYRQARDQAIREADAA